MTWCKAAVAVAALLANPNDEVAPNSPTSLVRPASIPPALDAAPKNQIPPAAAPSDPVAEPARKPLAVSGTPRGVASRLGKNPGAEAASAEKPPIGRQLTWWTTTGVGLAAVLAVIWVGGRLIRRVVPGAVVGDAAGPIHLLHRTFLTPKHAACLVKCGDRILVVGLAGDRMTTLAEIHDPQEIDYIRGQLMQVAPRAATRAFREVLSQSKFDATTPPPNDASRSGEPPRTVAGARPDRSAAPPNSANFAQQLAALRERISEWKSRTKPT
jgi:flagellar biogenesis protein FliO